MKLPPLNAVRVFESAARHGSMKRAAEELFVTPGAVSQQIRALEEHFGTALLERRPRALLMTVAGQEFYSAVTRHLRGISQAAEQVRPRDRQVALTVAPDFASRWLVPRLSLFAARNPRIEVRIDATFVMADFDRDPFDLGVRSVFSVPVGLHARLLLRQKLKPYCSPAYHAAHLADRDPAEGWRRARLLHESHPYDLWAPWFAAKGWPETNAEVGLYFSHGLLAILAAIDGEGVTLQPAEYVIRELGSGALVAADAESFESGLAYYLVWPKRPLKPAAEQFRDWIIDIAATGEQMPAAGATDVARMTRFDEPDLADRGVLRRIRAQPALFIASMAATGLMLCLAVAVLVATQSVRDGLSRAAAIRLSVFLDPRLPRADAEAMRSRIESASVVAGASLRTREDAWSAMAGRGLSTLSNRPNPLPDVWLVTLRLRTIDGDETSLATEVESARSAIAAIAGVDTVAYDRGWVDVVDRWSAAARWLSAVQWSIVALVASMLFCIFFLAGGADRGPNEQAVSSSGVTAAAVACAMVLTALGIAALILALPPSAVQPVVATAGHIPATASIGTALLVLAGSLFGSWCAKSSR